MRKTLPLLTAFCIVFNTFLSLSGTGKDAADMIDAAFVRSTSVFSYFAACKSPVEMMNSVVRSETPLAPGYASPSEKSDSPASSTVFITPRNHSNLLVKNEMKQNLPAEAGTIFSSLMRADFDKDHPPPGPGSFIFLMLLMYMVVLSMSNLPAEAYCLRRRR